MSLSTTTDFNEAGTSSADFAAQKIVEANSQVKSADVNTLVEKALRRTTYLDNIKVDIAGDTMTGLLTLNAGATVASGQTLTADGATIAGAKSVTGNTVFSGGNVTMNQSTSRKALYRARVALSDADQTVDVSDGDRFDLVAVAAAPRTITLDHTTVTPNGGEALTFFWNPGSSGGPGVTMYTFEREDSTVIATFVVANNGDTGAVFAEFEYVSGTGWRLGMNSGTHLDYTSATPGPESWDPYGVVPGAGA